MKSILVLTAVLSVIAVAAVGCLYIFEVLNYEDSMSNLVKVVGAVVLLGGCSALIVALMGSRNKPPE